MEDPRVYNRLKITAERIYLLKGKSHSTYFVRTHISVHLIHETLAKSHNLQCCKTTYQNTCKRSLAGKNVRGEDVTSLSLFPLGSKSLPPEAPPSLYGDRAFFNVCRGLQTNYNPESCKRTVEVATRKKNKIKK